MRVFVDKGMLIVDRVITHDGFDYADRSGALYFALLAYQVYDQNGDPIPTFSYRGPGEIHGRRIIFGDPQRTTNLLEGIVDVDATSESKDHFNGYYEAITAPRQLSAAQYQKKMYGKTFAWEDGYRQGYAERKARGVKKVPI